MDGLESENVLKSEIIAPNDRKTLLVFDKLIFGKKKKVFDLEKHAMNCCRKSNFF